MSEPVSTTTGGDTSGSNDVSFGKEFGKNLASQAASSGLQMLYGMGSALFSNYLNRRNWEAQNEYNLPENQMQRYLDAGLSPAAAAQAVAGIDSSAQSIEGVKAPDTGMQMNYLDNMYKQQHILIDQRLAEAEIHEKEALAGLYESQDTRIRTLLPTEKKKLQAEYDKLVSEKNLTDVQKQTADFLLEKMQQFKEEEFKQLQAKTQEIRATVNLLREQAKTEGSKRTLMYTEGVKNLASAEESMAGADLKKEEQKSVHQDVLKKQFDTFVRDFFHADPSAPMFEQWLQQLAHQDPNAVRILDAVQHYADNAVDELGDFAKNHPLLTAGAGVYGMEKLNMHYLDKITSLTGAGGRLGLKFKPSSAVHK